MSDVPETSAEQSEASVDTHVPPDAQVSQDTAEPPAAVRLGLLLREAREAQGMTVADIVAALKFSSRQIEALEADQLEQLPGSVFVRGIVRGYARLLKLDPEPLLALLDRDVPIKPHDVIPLEDMGVAMPGTSWQIPVAVTLGILAIVVAAAVGVWHFLAPQAVVPATAEQALIKTPVTAPMAEPATAAPASATLVAEGSANAPMAEAAAESAVPAVEEINTQAVPGTPGVKQLMFAFHDTSWVEVKDVSGRIIFTGQFEAGSRQVVNGRPPFQIVVGNAHVVDLKYADEKVDLAPYTRVDVARLTLE